MADILIIRNNCDAATQGTYWIGDGLVAHLQSKGHTVKELADANATPANVQYWLTSASNRTKKLVIAFDHGNVSAFYGELNDVAVPVITMANVKDLTKDLHVYTFACSTCANSGIGEKAIAEGTLSWLGYISPVYVFTDQNSTLFKTLKEVIWSFITKLADGFMLETAEKALRDAYAAHKNDHYVFGYNLDRLLLRKKTAGMTIHSHNRVGGKSLVGTWGGMVDWKPFDNHVEAGIWTFKNDGTWSYQYGGGRWIQIGETAIWTFSNAPGLVYTCSVGTGRLTGVMGYTTAPPNPGTGRFKAVRAAALAEISADPLVGPVEEPMLFENGFETDLARQPEEIAEPYAM